MSRWMRTLSMLIVAFSGTTYYGFSQAAVTLSNATTQVVVNGGEANNGLVPFNGYFRYTDLGASEETTWSIDPLLVFTDGSTKVLSNGAAGGFGSPLDIGGGVVRSTATVSALVAVQADTELIDSNAKTTFVFTDLSGNGLDGMTFVFYAENDLFSFANDAAAFTGSIPGNNLALFMFDSAAGGLSVKLTGEAIANSALTLFGAGIWTGFGTALEGGDLSVLSADGSNFVTLGDLGLALAFSLSGASATVVINYDTQPEPPLFLDHFLSYKTKPSKGSPKFTSLSVSLADQFEEGVFKVTKPASLANPADKNGEGIHDPDTHLEGYRIAKGPKHVRRNVKVNNQLGELQITTLKADRLFVPTAKSLTGPVDPPNPDSHNVDHFKCYKVKVTKGAPKFPKGLQATVGDQFTDPPKVFDLKKPTHLCTPVNKESEGIKNPDAHLMCYQAKPAKGQAKHQKKLGVFVNNQFGPGQVDTLKEEELCLPSTKTLLGASLDTEPDSAEIEEDE